MPHDPPDQKAVPGLQAVRRRTRQRLPEQVERAFRFALAGIKPTDAVIVGMYPRFKDEVRENTELVRRILA